MSSVTIDLRGLNNLEKLVRDGMRGGGKGNPIRRAFHQWGARYRGFVQERFDRFSKGGGNWKALSKATVKRRRKGRKRTARSKSKTFSTGSAAILKDTGTLFRALQPGFVSLPGQLEKDIQYGIRVGFGGPGKHPNSRFTIAQIARAHQTGAGKLPKREIIVDPDIRTVAGMQADMQRAVNKAVRQTDMGA